MIESNRRPYWRQKIALGTKHKKEQVMRPQFAMQLGATLIVPAEMDTDTLGTFSGEVERNGTPYEVAVKKAEWAMSLTGLPYGLANEGSFGPHPQIGFVPSDSEWMVFVDGERDVIISEHAITTKTNFGHVVVREVAEAAKFLEDIYFPSHGLIVRPYSSDRIVVEPLFKGICSPDDLKTAFITCKGRSADGRVQIETDMRAHMNPTRMLAIQLLTQKLVNRLRQLCNSCGTPGWGVVDAIPGLPCETCEAATQMIRQERHGCAKCDAFELVDRSDGVKMSPTQYCDRCNP